MRRVLPATVLVLGLVAAALFGVLVDRQADRSVMARFDVAADRATSVVELQLQRYTTLANAAAVAAATGSDQAGWVVLAEDLASRDDTPPVLSVEAMTLVLDGELDDYLAEQRREVSPAFTIRPSPDGRDRLAVIDRAWPVGVADAILGQDALASPPRRPGVERAVDTRQGSLSDALELGSSTGMVAYAVFDDEQGRPAGFGSLAFSGDDLLGDLSGRLPDLSVALSDPVTPDGSVDLGALHHPPGVGAFTAVRRVRAGGQELVLDVWASDGFSSTIESRAGLLTGLVLAVLALLAAAAVGTAVGGQQRAEKLVDRRTAELLETNDRLEQALRTRDDFLAKVTHEFRTPLTSIIGFSETIVRTDDDLSPSATAQIERISANARRLSRLVDDLLLAASMREHGLQVSTEQVVLLDVVTAVVEELDGADVVAVNVAPGAIAFVDEDHLHRILENLVSNAMKYGQPPIDITARRDGDRLVLTVRDHGPGIDEELRERAFEPFRQADEGDGRTVTGVGLGLSIVHDLVDANGGTVAIVAVDGPGACFEVRLPAAR